MLDNAILKDCSSGDAVAHVLASHEVSERRACQALDLDRSTIRYSSRRPDDTAVRAAIRELAAERRRFGYRRCIFCWPRRVCL